MRKVHIDSVKPGDVNGKSIYLFSHRLKLLNKGVRMKPEYIKKLKEYGVKYIYVDDKVSEGIELQEMIPDELMCHAKECVANVMRLVENGESIDSSTQPVLDTVKNIIDEIFNTKNLIVNLADIRAADDYTFGHSVSVCTLSLILGFALGLNDIELRELGVGAILHDIGKTKIPSEILNKPGKLTDEEFEIIKRHPQEGFEILRKVDTLSRNSVYVALAHHERYDGSGYPNGFVDSQIHLFAKICSIVDVFDAMISDRIYRKGMEIKKVVNYLKLMSNKHFNGELVDKFVSRVLIYPNGSHVLLNTNEKGIVVKSDIKNPERPVVRICIDPYGQPYRTFKEVDLMKNSEYTIVGNCEDFQI